MIKDRVLRGAFAGAIASLTLLAGNLFSHHILHFAKKTWLEALSQLVMGQSIKSAMDFVVAVGLLIIWNGFLGGFYVRYVIPERDGSYVGRAIVFGLFAWFAIFSIGTLFKIESLHVVAWQTAISNWISIIIYGIILGWLTKLWDEREIDKGADSKK